MRSIEHYDHGQKSERMKFLRIIFGCPEGARKWRILFFAMLLHSKKRPRQKAGAAGRAGDNSSISGRAGSGRRGPRRRRCRD